MFWNKKSETSPLGVPLGDLIMTNEGQRGGTSKWKDLGMHNIGMHEMTEAFFPCWEAAGLHPSKQVDGGIQPFASSEEVAVPLWRGHGMHVRFDGLD